MRKRLEIFALLLVVALCALLAAISHKAGSDEQHDTPEQYVRSSYYAFPEGYKALYLTLQELGYPVSRYSRPYALLPAQGTLIIADPYRAEISAYESRQLFAWLRRGNTALVLVEQHPGVLTALAATENKPAPDKVLQKVDNGPSSAYNTGWEQAFVNKSHTAPAAPLLAYPLAPAAGPALQVETSCHFPRHALLPPELLAKVGKTQPLYDDAIGVVAASSQVGAGKIIWCSSPWSLSNAGLAENAQLPAAGNLDFLLALLKAQPARPILFDEYHQGYGAEMTLISLAPAITCWGLAQLALVLLLLLALAVWRLGPIRLPAIARYTRSRAEYLTSMAGLLQRAGATGMVRDRLELLLKRELGRRLGLPLSADAALLLAANAAQRAVDQPLLQALLQRFAALQDQQRPDQDAMLQLAADLQTLLHPGGAAAVQGQRS